MIVEKNQSFPVSLNDLPLASVVTPINEKTPLIDFTLLNTLINYKPINNEKDKQIRESHIDTMVKNHEGNTPKNNILNNLHKNVEGMINRKMKASLEKIQSIYNDKLKVLRNKIINKLLETIENISNKAVQPYPLPIPQLHLEDDTNKSERK